MDRPTFNMGMNILQSLVYFTCLNYPTILELKKEPSNYSYIKMIRLLSDSVWKPGSYFSFKN
jgi:hypothetical protein